MGTASTRDVRRSQRLAAIDDVVTENDREVEAFSSSMRHLDD